jgi:hypothetical protein
LKEEDSGTSSNVSVNGGTRCYQVSKSLTSKAPELFKQFAKFNSKADVFAAGIVFLELISMLPPNSLYYDLWPKVMELEMPAALSLCLSGTLQEDPDRRNTFDELFQLFSSEEGKRIADQDYEEYAAEFYDVSGKIQDFVSGVSSSRNYSHSSSKF